MGKLGDPRKLRCVNGLPLAILVEAGEFLERENLFDGFKARPYGDTHVRLSQHLWSQHKPSLQIETRAFLALEKIAAQGVDAWNQNPAIEELKFQLLAAPPCRWPLHIDQTCTMIASQSGMKAKEVKTMLLNY